MIGILAFVESELLYLACCADYQFQVYAIATPDPFCQYGGSLLVRLKPCDLEVTVRNMYLSLENSSVDVHETDF